MAGRVTEVPGLGCHAAGTWDPREHFRSRGRHLPRDRQM